MATTALLAVKPMQSIAKSGGSLSFQFSNDSISFLHTQNISDNLANMIASGNMNCRHKYSLLFDTGHTPSQSAVQNLGYHAILPNAKETTHRTTQVASNLKAGNNDQAENIHPYKIIYKGNVKIGVVGAVGHPTDQTEKNTLNEVNLVAELLKTKHHCNLVVCISNLGYSNKNNIDDKTLAAESVFLDVIIGNRTDVDYKKSSAVVLNKNKSEVILNYTNESDVMIGNLQIGFDEAGNKNKISFSNVAMA